MSAWTSDTIRLGGDVVIGLILLPAFVLLAPIFLIGLLVRGVRWAVRHA